MFFVLYSAVKQTIKQLVKRSVRPSTKDIKHGRVPYEPKKAPPFNLEELLKIRSYCLQSVEVSFENYVLKRLIKENLTETCARRNARLLTCYAYVYMLQGFHSQSFFVSYLKYIKA